MALIQATPAGRCGHCGRALLIPTLREVASPDDAPRTLARCAWCGSANVVVAGVDHIAAQRAAAISFVTRGFVRSSRR